MRIEEFRCRWVGGDNAFSVSATDIQLPTGRVAVLTGDNGSGKTTFLRGLARHAGLQIEVDRILPATEFFYVHQQAERALFPSLTLREALYALLAARAGSFWNVRDVPPLESLVAELPKGVRDDLRDFAARPVEELSGGYKSLVAVAAAAVGFPGHGLLLDEPAAGLDSEHRSAMAKHLVTIATNRTTPVVVTTHQDDFAVALGGRTLHIRAGVVYPE